MKSKHKLSLESEEHQPGSCKKAKIKQKSITSFLEGKKESLQTIVSQLAAVDGFSIHAIGKSKFIRDSISVKGVFLPASDSSIMNLVHREHNDIQKEVKSKIELKLKSDTRFSLTLDEYTSVCCRRCMNVHCENDAINLGLIRMFDSCGAEKILQLLKTKLADFGIINMQTSVVSIVTDGASVIKKLGRISHLDCQLCHAHELHLAILLKPAGA